MSPSSKRKAPRTFLFIVFCITIAPYVIGYIAEMFAGVLGCQIGSIDYMPSAEASCPALLSLFGRVAVFGLFTGPIGGALIGAGLIWLAISDTFAKPEETNREGFKGAGLIVTVVVVLLGIAAIFWQLFKPL